MALLEMRGVYKTFNAGTPDEVRQRAGQPTLEKAFISMLPEEARRAA